MPGEFSWPLKTHGNGDGHARAFLQPHEIDMNGPVGYRIDLDIARQNALLLAADFEHDERRVQAPGGVELLEAPQFHLHRLGFALAAIEDARDEALLPQLIGGAFALFLARLGAQLLDGTHGNPSEFLEFSG